MFDGNAEEALNFYKDVFQGEIQYMMRYGDGDGGGPEIPKDYEQKVMHVELAFGDNILYLSDNFPGAKTSFGDAISLNIMIDSEEQMNQIYEGLSVNGSNLKPPKKEFWGSLFASLDDQYGFHWSLNHDLSQA